MTSLVNSFNQLLHEMEKRGLVRRGGEVNQPMSEEERRYWENYEAERHPDSEEDSDDA